MIAQPFFNAKSQNADGRIFIRYDSLPVDHDNDVRGLIRQGPEPLFFFQQFILYIFAVCNVHGFSHDGYGFAVFVADETQVIFNPQEVAVCVDGLKFQNKTGFVGRRGGGHCFG